MAGPYYVDATKTGGGNTGADWTNAYLSVFSVPALASGEICYIAHNHVEPDPGSAKTITGATSGAPAIIMSVTQDSNPVAYAASTSKQINTEGGNYDLVFDGGFALYGVSCSSGQHIDFLPDANETLLVYGCTFLPGVADSIRILFGAEHSLAVFDLCTFNYASTTSSSTTACFQIRGNVELKNCSLSNITNRTGSVFVGTALGSLFTVSGLDMSSAPSTLDLVTGGADYGYVIATNVKLPATFAGFVAADYTKQGFCFATNCDSEDSPEQLYFRNYLGTVASTTLIYRDGGADVEGTPVGWLITTTANCAEGAPFYTPWRYGVLSSTGSKTFSCAISHDNAGGGTGGYLTNAECWMEVEYLKDADEAQWFLASGHRVITATAADWAADSTSTWTGAEGADKQTVSVTATIGEIGQYRWRLAFGKASISANLHIDPKVTVS